MKNFARNLLNLLYILLFIIFSFVACVGFKFTFFSPTSSSIASFIFQGLFPFIIGVLLMESVGILLFKNKAEP